MILVRLGNNIKELRHKSGLSQEKFALQIGMDANGLGVPMSELLNEI